MYLTLVHLDADQPGVEHHVGARENAGLAAGLRAEACKRRRSIDALCAGMFFTA